MSDNTQMKKFQFTPPPLNLTPLILRGLLILGFLILPIACIHAEESISSNDRKFLNDALRQSVAPASSRITLDGKAYTKDQLIWDFTHTAFGYSLWLNNSATPWSSVRLVNQTHTPLPEFGAINKWASDVTIGLGWDPSMPQLSGLDKEANAKLLQEKSALVSQTLSNISGALEKSSGLTIRYLAPEEEAKSGKSAQIRIIPERDTLLYNRYKMANTLPPNVNSHIAYLLYLQNLSNAQPFTPYSRSQVEGFIERDETNTIQKSVCRISNDNTDEMFSALLTECVVRALGLPELSKAKENSILSNWNSIADSKSLIPAFDGVAAFHWPRHEKDKEAPPLPSDIPKLTEYDLALVRILYCPAIHNGMDANAAIKALYKEDSCFTQSK